MKFVVFFSPPILSYRGGQQLALYAPLLCRLAASYDAACCAQPGLTPLFLCSVNQNQEIYYVITRNIAERLCAASLPVVHPTASGYPRAKKRLIPDGENWQLDYATDFHYAGHPWPEFKKDVDVS